MGKDHTHAQTRVYPYGFTHAGLPRLVFIYSPSYLRVPDVFTPSITCTRGRARSRVWLCAEILDFAPRRDDDLSPSIKICKEKDLNEIHQYDAWFVLSKPYLVKLCSIPAKTRTEQTVLV